MQIICLVYGLHEQWFIHSLVLVSPKDSWLNFVEPHDRIMNPYHILEQFSTVFHVQGLLYIKFVSSREKL